MTPALGAQVSLPSIAAPPLAKVALVGLDNPLTEVLATVAVVNNDIFNGADTYADYQWEPYQGLIPEFIYSALPIISQLGYNGASYIGGSVAALNNSATILSEAVWNLPGAVITEFSRTGESVFALTYTLGGGSYHIDYTATLTNVSMTFTDAAGKQTNQTYTRR